MRKVSTGRCTSSMPTGGNLFRNLRERSIGPILTLILRSASCLPANVRACIWPCDSRRCRLVTRCRRSDDQPDYNCEQCHRAEACLLASSTYAAHMLFGAAMRAFPCVLLVFFILLACGSAGGGPTCKLREAGSGSQCGTVRPSLIREFAGEWGH
jgi:hypothetical protein